MATDTQKEIRVLIVDDSAFMRKVLETILITDEHVHVVGHAKDGREAVRLADNFERVVGFEDVFEHFAHERRIVHDQNAKFLVGGDWRHGVAQATGTGRIASDPISCSTAAMS